MRLAKVPDFRKALRRGVGAAIEHQPVLESLKAGTVIDVGANNGQFSLVARHAFPDARIYAFEPLKEPAATLQELFQHDRNVVLKKMALGDEDKTSVINVSHRADSSSILPISDLQSELFPGTHKDNEEQIVIRRGQDEFADVDFAHPALLKLDVQGYELEVLVGFGDKLRDIDYVYAEVSFVELYVGQRLAHEVIEWLAARGLHLSGIYNVSYADDGTAIQADALFVRKAS